jgi:hypothetical protein
MLTRKRLLILAMLISLLFNITFITIQVSTERTDSQWMFPELGPAVIQDSVFGRAPALESPIGVIGNLPGALPIYNGNPLQTSNSSTTTRIPDVTGFLVIIILGLAPILFVLIIGRRSYGTSKTQ